MSDDAPTQVHGTPGEQCTTCSAPLAADQRYCLNCGERRAERRVPVAAAGLLATRTTTTTAVATTPARVPAAQRLGGAWGVAALLLIALGVGVIIGDLGGDEAAPAAAQRAPQVVLAGAATGPTGAAVTPVAATGPAADEWPDQDGWTVQLGELPAGTDQAAADAAKAAATAKGADAPGVLDPAQHGLTAGTLVLYAGVFATKKQAEAALGDLSSAYPDARVIEVKAEAPAADASSGASDDGGDEAPPADAVVSKEKLRQTENLDPESFQKQSKKLPKTTATPGKAPPTDDAAPGGGGEAETIG